MKPEMYFFPIRTNNLEIEQGQASAPHIKTRMLNPQTKQHEYPDGDTDKEMLLFLSFVADHTLLGMLNWFACTAKMVSENIRELCLHLPLSKAPRNTPPGMSTSVATFAATITINGSASPISPLARKWWTHVRAHLQKIEAGHGGRLVAHSLPISLPGCRQALFKPELPARGYLLRDRQRAQLVQDCSVTNWTFHQATSSTLRRHTHT